MKGKQRKNGKNFPFIVILATLTLVQFPIQAVPANDQIHLSFNPRPNEPPSTPIDFYPLNGTVDTESPTPLKVHL